MDSSFLLTRLRVPPVSQHVVRRERLLDALERAVPQYKLALLSAPAGYGKTTLLSQWARSTRHRVAWLSLSEEDNELQRFLRYLFRAWERVQPDVGESSLGWLLSSRFVDAEAVLSAFINLADELADPMVFVIDDFHLITEQAIHTSLSDLLDNLPPTQHFVLCSRSDPPLPLARYRARRELLEIRAEDLRFDLSETRVFLADSMDLELPRDQMDLLHSQLEGWVAGLQLAALSLQRSRDADVLPMITGRHRFIADYLAEDVLRGQPDEVQEFLLHTSILESLSGDICNAVTRRGDGQAMLETLERENLFLEALDDNRELYRYHGLFAEFLHEELKQRLPDEISALHRRAARWYLDQDQADPAFKHAVEGNDVELTAEIFDLYMNAKLLAGEFRTVNEWLSALPEEWYSIYPVLGLSRAGFLAFSGDVGGCMRCIDEIEQRLKFREPEEARWQQARVLTVRCFLACMRNDVTQAEELADRALRDLSEDDLGFRPGIYAALGDVYRQNARWAEANANYLKVLDYAASPAVRVQSAHVFGALADLNLRQGNLRNAERYWREALATLGRPENWGRAPLPVIGWIFIRLAEILYEWNQLTDSWEHVSAGIQRAELGGDARALIAGNLIAGRLKLTEGDVEAASDYLEQARSLVEQAQFHEWVSRFERFQLELWLAQDHLRAAVDWADMMLQDDTVLSRPESEGSRIAMARALVMKGDGQSLERGLGLIDDMLRIAVSDGRTHLQIEALALQSLAYWRRGDQASAMSSLENALRLAEPEGYVRLFVDLGLPVARLLQEALSREVMPDYVEALLAAYGPVLTSGAESIDRLPEPLTDRELEIVSLLAAGLTNNEIADRLFISPETVKKHTGNIYGKLGVRRRTEAVARARSLDLLA